MPAAASDAFRLLNTGSTGCTMAGLFLPGDHEEVWLAPGFVPRDDVRLVTKVVFDPEHFERELAAARLCYDIDPDQRYLLYPMAAYRVGPSPRAEEVLRACSAHWEAKGKAPYRPPPGAGMYLLVMQDGGRSLADLASDPTAVYNQAAVQRILQDLVGAVSAIHYHPVPAGAAPIGAGNFLMYVHGDLHKHNVVIRPGPDGLPETHLIDFGLMEPTSHIDDQEKDLKGLMTLIRMVMTRLAAGQGAGFPFKEDIRRLPPAPPLARIQEAVGVPTPATEAPQTFEELMAQYAARNAAATNSPSFQSPAASPIKKKMAFESPAVSQARYTRRPGPGSPGSPASVAKRLRTLTGSPRAGKP